MTQEGQVEVSLEKVVEAIDIVGGVLNTVNIPGHKAQVWATAGLVLNELKAWAIQEKKKSDKATEELKKDGV